MKTYKRINMLAIAIYIILACICFFNAVLYEIDAYDFGAIYKYLNPAKIFVTFAIAHTVFLIFLKKQDNLKLTVEKLFAIFVIASYICFGAAFFTHIKGNQVYSEQIVKVKDFENAEISKKYLPYYEFDMGGDYEIFKGDCKGNVMICVSSFDVDYKNNYDLEYLETNSLLLRSKYLLQYLVLDGSDIIFEAEKQEMNIDGLTVNLYITDYAYAALINSDGKVMYSELQSFEDDLSVETFAKNCTEQFLLMQKVVEEDRL